MTSAQKFLAVLALLTLSVDHVQAAPLDAAACDAAMVEQSQLSEVPALIERGPDWGRAHATPKALKRVARWIELQEMLSFRCGRGRVTADAQRAAAAAELLENPPPPPPKVPVVVNGAVKDATGQDGAAKDAAFKDGAAKDAAGAAKDASIAATEAAAAAKEAAKQAAAAARVAATQAGADDAAKQKAAKPKPKPKPKSDSVDAADAPAETTAASPAPKKKSAKPADAYVPPANGGTASGN